VRARFQLILWVTAAPFHSSKELKEVEDGNVREESKPMKKLILLLAILGFVSFGCATQANAGVHVGIGIGVPAYGYYGPGPYYGYYGSPYPYYGYYGYPYPYYGYYGHPWRGGYYGGGYYGHGGYGHGGGGHHH